MGWAEEREERVEARRQTLHTVVPGDGFVAWIDRASWSIMNQQIPGVWSWPRALASYVGATVVAVVLYLLINDLQPSYVVSIVAAWTIFLFRARHAHADYLRRTGEST